MINQIDSCLGGDVDLMMQLNMALTRLKYMKICWSLVLMLTW